MLENLIILKKVTQVTKMYTITLISVGIQSVLNKNFLLPTLYLTSTFQIFNSIHF